MGVTYLKCDNCEECIHEDCVHKCLCGYSWCDECVECIDNNDMDQEFIECDNRAEHDCCKYIHCPNCNDDNDSDADSEYTARVALRYGCEKNAQSEEIKDQITALKKRIEHLELVNSVLMTSQSKSS